MLENAQQQTTFFLMLGYDKERVRGHVESMFPGCDFESLWATADAQQVESNRQLDAAVAREDARAVEAEHDVSKSMHNRRSDK